MSVNAIRVPVTRIFCNFADNNPYDTYMRPSPLDAACVRLVSRPALLLALTFIVLCLCAAFADFSTKGEPREALVAVEMLRSGNWILPIDQNGDMAYKPPMFHWLVALLSLPAGHVSEFSSRLPSVLALTLVAALVFRFCARARTREFGLLCAALALTCFEMLRAGTVCRVDMVLTLFMTGAMMALYAATNTPLRKKRLIYMMSAVLCMSGGALTKGPVAVVLPLGVWWVWSMLRRENLLKVTAKALLLAVAALLLPALWYWAAWRQGGDRFLSLAMEENFGRFLGHMSYESHVKPMWYNLTSLLTGLLPWSAALAATVFLPRMRPSLTRLRHWKETWQAMSPAARFALVASVVVFVFYCIPKSKRSVYLLPMYPFMAYGLGCYAEELVNRSVISAKSLRRTLAGVGCLLFIGFAIAFPIISKRDSDKQKAVQIAKIVPQGSVYSFIPDRFMRFFITDFYLGGRIVSLLPSGQVNASTREPDASMIQTPPTRPFYMLTTADIYDATSSGNDYGLHTWLENNTLKAETVYRSESRGHDIKGHFILLHITDRQ